jgi:hypothetical protein
LGSGLSAIGVSVVRTSAPIDAAFWSAERGNPDHEVFGAVCAAKDGFK